MKVKFGDLRVGRVLHEDDDFVTLEVAKSDHRELQLEQGDAFWTLLFVKHAPVHGDPGRMKAWLPWERRDGTGSAE